MNVFKNTRALILTMSALVLCGILISYFYYKNVNTSADPRILEARLFYEKYNSFSQENKFDSIFWLMDTIESIYSRFDHYKCSYEVGVLYNNRAATYLTISQNEVSPEYRDSLINKAETAVNRSITIYSDWMNKFDNKTPDEIEEMVRESFLKGLENYSNDEKEKYLRQRINEISDAQIETKRRLSVSLTNLGVIYRHRLQYEMAAKTYKEAMDYWDRNLTAENNLNILLGRQIKKRNLIQKLFPPERVKTEY